MADLAKTARQLDKFFESRQARRRDAHKQVMSLVEEERARLIAHVRREPTTTRREAEPRPPQPVPVEPAFRPRRRPSPSKVLVVENDVPRAARNLDEIGAASDDLPMTVYEIPRQPRRSFTEMLGTFMEESSVRWANWSAGC